MIGANIREPTGQDASAAEQIELSDFGALEPVVAGFRGREVVIGRSPIGS